jgi:hypothetical protein
MPGHVFVTRGDLTKLYCDAWLLPSDASLSVASSWRSHLLPEFRDRIRRLQRGEAMKPANWRDRGVRVISLDDPTENPRKPFPFLVNVGGGHSTPVDWYLEGARQFFQAVRQHFNAGRTFTKRPNPLVALPLIGTGYGGASDIKGAMVRALLGTLYEAAAQHDIDIVLVTNNAPALAAAQNARWQRLRGRDDHPVNDPWPDLHARLRADAERLSRHVIGGNLVLFLGAGVSRGAGLPDWEALLGALAEDAKMNEREREALTRLHNHDRARLIQTRLAMTGASLGKAISDRLTSDHHSLVHSLLATLPVSEVVTTNYDRLFEEASVAAGCEVAVLPYASVGGRSRWLLKMHGSVTHPDDIVLTREDYLRYADRRAALAGIVQALLITRHMLFVGFSLTDDNFHQIVDAVRKAMRGVEGRTTTGDPFGTAMLLVKDELLEELWKGDLNLVSISDPNQADAGQAARQLEIFLDFLLAGATRATSPLLDPAYDGILSDEEREIRDLLERLEAEATDKIRRSPAWQPIAELFQMLGKPVTRE